MRQCNLFLVGFFNVSTVRKAATHRSARACSSCHEYDRCIRVESVGKPAPLVVSIWVWLPLLTHIYTVSDPVCCCALVWSGCYDSLKIGGLIHSWCATQGISPSHDRSDVPDLPSNTELHRPHKTAARRRPAIHKSALAVDGVWASCTKEPLGKDDVQDGNSD